MGVYGTRKMWKAINRAHPDDPVARCTVERRMRALGLSGVPNARSTRTTRPAPLGGHEPRDRLERDFTAAAPDQRWVADITYVATWTGFVYVALVMDLFARRVVGWRVSRSLRTDLALDAPRDRESLRATAAQRTVADLIAWVLQRRLRIGNRANGDYARAAPGSAAVGVASRQVPR